MISVSVEIPLALWRRAIHVRTPGEQLAGVIRIGLEKEVAARETAYTKDNPHD